MKFAVISNIERAAQLVAECRASKILPFIFQHADPDRQLSKEPFLYVSSDDEIIEKTNLLKADFTICDNIKF